ncbi:MAG: hypothetical protein IT305_17755 [Chloroflexi bacterium]|nr:hypothetical protein [Chloroflexota bacterium]
MKRKLFLAGTPFGVAAIVIASVLAQPPVDVAAQSPVPKPTTAPLPAARPATTTAPRAGGMPMELAVMLAGGGTALAGGGAYALRRRLRRS